MSETIVIESRLKMPSLAKVSVSGFAWSVAQSGGARVIGLVSQILLARLLRPGDFGDVATASSVVAVIAVLVGFGIDDVLLSRARTFSIWAAPAFWLSLAFSLLGAITLLASAPVAARLYRSPTVFGLLAILASSLPLAALGVVPSAFLRSKLQFRFLATYATVELLASQLLTILLAWRGFGAFSFVIPTPLAALIRAVVLWRMARPVMSWHVKRRQLWPLLHSGATLFGTKLITALRQNGDYLLLGLFAAKSSVGLYFMAFRLAAVPVYTLAGSLSGVLFPALAQLRGERSRQRIAVLSASRVVALAVIPLSFLQAALAGPVMRLFFGEKWAGAAPLLSILSIGLAFDVIPCVAGALLTANGKFRAQWFWSLAVIPFFFGAIGVGCVMAGAFGVALSVAIFFIVSSPAYSYFALRYCDCSLRDIAGIYLPPTLCATAAITFALLLSRVPQTKGHDLATITIVCSVVPILYILFVRRLSPTALCDARQKLALLWGRSV